MVVPMNPSIDAVRRAVAERDDLVAAWVFGSVARGSARPDSDVDIAVLRGKPASGTLEDLPTELALYLERAVGREVDLVVIDDADVELVHRVLRDGVLVLDRDRPRRIAFEVRKRHEYFDLVPRLASIREAALRRARRVAS